MREARAKGMEKRGCKGMKIYQARAGPSILFELGRFCLHPVQTYTINGQSYCCIVHWLVSLFLLVIDDAINNLG